MDISIALDAMGGDFGPEVVVPAALQYQRSKKDVRLLLVGLPDKIREALQEHGASESARLVVVPAEQIVGMDEEPSAACIALEAVPAVPADACAVT